MSWLSLAVLAEDPNSGLSPALPQEVQEPLCTSALYKQAVGNSEIQFLTLELFLLLHSLKWSFYYQRKEYPEVLSILKVSEGQPWFSLPSGQ